MEENDTNQKNAKESQTGRKESALAGITLGGRGRRGTRTRQQMGSTIPETDVEENRDI